MLSKLSGRRRGSSLTQSQSSSPAPSPTAVASPSSPFKVSAGPDASYFAQSTSHAPLGVSSLHNQTSGPLDATTPAQPHSTSTKRPRAHSKLYASHPAHPTSAKENQSLSPPSVPQAYGPTATPHTSDSMTSRLLRRVSSAPNTKALASLFSASTNEPLPSNHQNIPGAIKIPPTGVPFPSTGSVSGSAEASNTMSSSTSAHADLSLASSPKKQHLTAPRSKTSPSLSETLATSSTTAIPNTLTIPSTPSTAPSSPRANFRRTYSASSIKVKHVEVGPSSFSKIKLLGKGDVGKVYLVKEKKTEKLFAMKGQSSWNFIVLTLGCRH